MESKEWFVTYKYYRKELWEEHYVTESMFMYGAGGVCAQDVWKSAKQDNWEIVSIVRV